LEALAATQGEGGKKEKGRLIGPYNIFLLTRERKRRRLPTDAFSSVCSERGGKKKDELYARHPPFSQLRPRRKKKGTTQRTEKIAALLTSQLSTRKKSESFCSTGGGGKEREKNGLPRRSLGGENEITSTHPIKQKRGKKGERKAYIIQSPSFPPKGEEGEKKEAPILVTLLNRKQIGKKKGPELCTPSMLSMGIFETGK